MKDTKGSEKVNRPSVDTNLVIRVVEQYFGLIATSVTELNSYSDRNFHVLVDCEQCTNKNISSPSANGYVLKFMNELPLSDKQVRILNCMEQFQPIHGNMPVCPQIIKSIDDKDNEIVTGETEAEAENRYFTARLFSFIPGNILLKYNCSDELLVDLGSKMALIHVALDDFPKPSDCESFALFTMEKMSLVQEKLFAVEDLELRELLSKILRAFDHEVLPASKHFQKGYIHYDLNEQNILVDDASPDKICAIIDWQDSVYSCLVYDVAICMAYICALGQNSNPPMSIETSTGLVFRGYQSEKVKNKSSPLNETEIEMLPILLASRMAQSIVNGLYHYYVIDQTNQYVLVSVPGFIKLLKLLVEIPKYDLINAWKNM